MESRDGFTNLDIVDACLSKLDGHKPDQPWSEEEIEVIQMGLEALGNWLVDCDPIRYYKDPETGLILERGLPTMEEQIEEYKKIVDG